MTKKFDVENRHFILNKNVASDTLEDIILGILEINRKDDEEEKKLAKYKRKPIKLIVDSYGGSCYDGLLLVNIIRTSKTPIHTYCYSKAMSMGLCIFACGHKRFAHKDAYLMHHQLAGQSGGMLMDIIESAEQKLKLQETLDEIILEHSNIQRETIMKYRERKFNWFFTGKEGKKLGIVDELIEV